MKIKTNFAAAAMLLNSMAGIAIASDGVSYQCAFVTNPSAYESLAFNLQNTDAPVDGPGQNKLERNFEVDNNNVSMTVQQIGLDHITATISQVVIVGTTPVTSISSTSATVGTKALSLQATTLPAAEAIISLNCSLR